MHFILPFYIKEKIINNYKNEIQKTELDYKSLDCTYTNDPF